VNRKKRAKKKNAFIEWNASRSREQRTAAKNATQAKYVLKWRLLAANEKAWNELKRAKGLKHQAASDAPDTAATTK